MIFEFRFFSLHCWNMFLSMQCHTPNVAVPACGRCCSLVLLAHPPACVLTGSASPPNKPAAGKVQ